MEKSSIHIRNQLLVAMSFFTLLGIVIAFLSMYYIHKIHDIYKVSDLMQGLYKNYSKAISSEQSFLQLETNRNYFYETGNSVYVEELKKNLNTTYQELNVLKSEEAYNEYEIDEDVKKLVLELNEYETTFLTTVEKVRLKGFHNFGLEGKMRKFIQELEGKSKEIGLEHVLMLRRLERDYMLRNDPEYLRKLDFKISDVKNIIWSDEEIRYTLKDSLNNILNNYQTSFQDLGKIIHEIGYKNNEGLNDRLTISKNVIDKHFATIQSKTEIKAKILINNLQIGFIFLVVNVLAVSIFIILLYTYKNKKSKENLQENKGPGTQRNGIRPVSPTKLNFIEPLRQN